MGNLHYTRTDPMLLHRLGTVAPVCAILHDFYLLTGRCAYSFDCHKYLDGCDATCPTPDEYPPLEPARIAGAYARKRAVLAGPKSPVLLAYSHWAESVAAGALDADPSLASLKLDRCELGLPTDEFPRLPKLECRRLLGLPLDRFLVLLSGDPTDPRKGFPVALDALRILGDREIGVVACGVHATRERVDWDHTYPMGFIKDARIQAMLYSAVDLFVGASWQETFGQVFIEAAACGTPSVGFAGSGVEDAIVDGVTGILVKERTAEALAAAIATLRESARLRAWMGGWARIHAENEWSLQRLALSIHRALRRTGLAERLALRRKITFRPTPPPVPEAASVLRAEGGPAAHTLGNLEGPYEPLNLGFYRWAYGPRSCIEYRSPEAAEQTMVLRYRNPHPAQRFKVWVNAQQVDEGLLAETGYHDSAFYSSKLPLRKGPNEIVLEFSCWNRDQADPRPLAIIVEWLDFLPVC